MPKPTRAEIEQIIRQRHAMEAPVTDDMGACQQRSRDVDLAFSLWVYDEIDRGTDMCDLSSSIGAIFGSFAVSFLGGFHEFDARSHHTQHLVEGFVAVINSPHTKDPRVARFDAGDSGQKH